MHTVYTVHTLYIYICIYTHTFLNIDASLPVSSLIKGCAKTFHQKNDFRYIIAIAVQKLEFQIIKSSVIYRLHYKIVAYNSLAVIYTNTWKN